MKKTRKFGFKDLLLAICLVSIALPSILTIYQPALGRRVGVNIVLMSWDGVERTVFYELLNKGSLPNVAKLNIYNMTCNLEYNSKTSTKPQHAIMLSGYLADTTETTTNHLPNWKPLGSKSIFYRIKEIKPIYYVAGLITKPKFLTPILLNHENPSLLEGKIIGVYRNRNGFSRVESFQKLIAPPEKEVTEGIYARQVTRDVLRLASARAPFFYFFHISDIDAYGHKWGVNSRQYRKAIKDSDRLLGKLMDKLPSGTIFIITSDHGFGTNGNERQHVGASFTFIASNLNLRNGYEVDVAPTIYQILGIDITQFKPAIDGVSLLTPDAHD